MFFGVVENCQMDFGMINYTTLVREWFFLINNR